MAQKNSTHSAEGFVGSIAKYSISTFANIIIMAAAIIFTDLFVPIESHGQISLFTTWTGTIMTVAILGLDQALIRFYHERPAGLSKNGLFRLCFYFSSIALLVVGVFSSTLFAGPVHSTLGFTLIGPTVVPLLFLNAFFFMVARYFNVLYRMEGNILLYTVVSVLMQFFYRLFYLLGMAFGFENPVPAMVLCSVAGLGAFALVFSINRRKTLRPNSAEFRSGGYKTLLPYGFAVAPTAVFVTLNSSISQSYITHQLGATPNGIYSFANTLSNAVTLIQGGFASFWGPYMFENYKEHNSRIRRVHDYLNLIILVFFCCLVAFQDIIFVVLSNKAEARTIFPLMMLAAVFTILCETTVYGNAIARKPVFDTIGIGLSFALNIGLCVILVPRLELIGAAMSLAAANGAMFLFRTFTAQRLYRSIQSPLRTTVAVLIAIAVGALGTLWAVNLPLRLALCAIAIGLYCLLYHTQLVYLFKLGFSMLQSLLKRPNA